RPPGRRPRPSKTPPTSGASARRCRFASPRLCLHRCGPRVQQWSVASERRPASERCSASEQLVERDVLEDGVTLSSASRFAIKRIRVTWTKVGEDEIQSAVLGGLVVSERLDLSWGRWAGRLEDEPVTFVAGKVRIDCQPQDESRK